MIPYGFAFDRRVETLSESTWLLSGEQQGTTREMVQSDHPSEVLHPA